MKHIDEDVHEWRARMARGGAGAPKPKCKLCDGKGWRFRTPDGFNPFSAGGWNTIKAMYRVPCRDCSASAPSDAVTGQGDKLPRRSF